MPSYRLIHEHIQSWYDLNGRKTLPWRMTTDPYHVYVSEVMLQQTQVKTVLERYYFPFLEQFPTLTHLAEADQQAVLKAWEGLGYYSRARNLHQAAKLTAPELPADYEALMALPGIGTNTAHAILAFAFKQPVPIMDANVKRILYRFFAKKEASPAELWTLAGRLLDTRHPFEYNQAMMDIGSLLCTIRAPECHACPLATGCRGKKHPLAYPEKKQRLQTPVRTRGIVAWQDQKGRYFLQKRTTTFLGGLYGFMQYETTQIPYFTRMHALGEVVQVYSHFRLEATLYQYQKTHKGRLPDLPKEGGWFTWEEMTTLPLSQVDKKILQVIGKS